MPSFKSKLSPAEIKQVAAFVSTAAGTGRAGKISFEPNDQKVEDCKDTACYEQAFGNLAYNDGPKKALESWTRSRRRTDRRGGLPPDRAQDRRRRAPLLQGRRGQGVRRRQRHVRLRLLPRPAAVEARRSPGRPGRGPREHRLQRPEHRGKRVHLLPVQPRPRARPDALHGLDLPQALDYCHKLQTAGGLDHVQRRSLHGEPELVVRAALEVAEHEEPALPLQQQVRASGRTSSTATCSSRRTSSRTSTAAGRRPPTGAGRASRAG